MRRRITQAPPAGPTTLADFSVRERLGLTAGWYPAGHPERDRRHDDCRWQSWDDFIAAAAAVEAELEQRDTTISPWKGPQTGIMDERAHNYVHHPDKSFGRCVLSLVRAHERAALETASDEQIRNHVDPSFEAVCAAYQQWKRERR